MKSSSVKHGLEQNDKGLRQNFFTLGSSKGHLYPTTTSKERLNTSSQKKLKTNSSVKNFGGNIVQNQIGKVRVSSGGRAKPGITNQPEKQLKYLLHDSEKYKRKTGGGSHSRNQVYQIPSGSNTGRSYNKSNIRESSPNNISKSPKNPAKKSRNKKIVASQTQIATKRRSSSKKFSKDQDAFKTMKGAIDKGKKDSIFLMYQQYPKMTKTTQIGAQNRTQFSALSPKTVKNIMKTSNSGISGFEKYQMKANPSKYSDARASKDKRMAGYLNNLASEGSKSKEDLRYVPVENISLFDDSNVPMSARNPKITSGLYSQRSNNIDAALQNIGFIRNFRIIKIFKFWAAQSRRQKYLYKRQQLAEKLPWGKPYFAQYITSVIEPLNEIRYCSPLVEIKSKNVYSKKSNGHQGFILQCSSKQKQSIARLGKKFFKVIKALDKLCKFKLSLLKPTRKYQYEKEIAINVIDRALGYILTSAVFSIRDMIRNEQNNLFRLIVPNKDYQHQVKFDFQLEFDNNGGIISNPSFDEYTIQIMNLYDSIRKTV